MATLGSVIVEDMKGPEKSAIDREKTCPLLLRVFSNTGRHNSTSEYTATGQVPGNELQIYTWMDATLKELANLVKEVNPDARRPGTMFDFSLIYPDFKFRGPPGYRARQIGTIITGQSQKSSDDNRTLAQVRFTIGDYLDIAITPQSRVIPMKNMRRDDRDYRLDRRGI